jgi:hypothetical protein
MTHGQRILADLLGIVAILLVLHLIVAAAAPALAHHASPRQEVLPVPPATAPVAAAPADGAPAAHPAAGGVVEFLRARTIEIVDASGRTLIRLGADELGHAGIATLDPKGTPLTVFGQYKGGGMISTFDSGGRALVVITHCDGRGRIIYGTPATPEPEALR